jgi:hypothetical protein
VKISWIALAGEPDVGKVEELHAAAGPNHRAAEGRGGKVLGRGGLGKGPDAKYRRRIR